MGWLKKIFGDSNPRVSAGQSHGRYGEDSVWDCGHNTTTTSVDAWSYYGNEDIHRAIALSLSEEDYKRKKVIDHDSYLDKDEQFAMALQDSLNMESPPLYDNDNVSQPEPEPEHGDEVEPESPPEPQPNPFFYPFGYSRKVYAGCKAEIGHGRFLSCMGGVLHPACFGCHACNVPISDYEFSMSGERPYHKSCYKSTHHPNCDVCNNFIPTNEAGLTEYRAHPFWMQKYCPSHEQQDKTPRCCSCERMEPRDTQYLVLDDGRKLRLECLDSTVMDTVGCVYTESNDFEDRFRLF